MTDLNTTKREIIDKIIEIQSIPRPMHSAQQLHGGMMGRAQRQMDREYYKKLMVQKTKLQSDLKSIEEYEQKQLSLPIKGAPLVPVPSVSLWDRPLPKRQFTRIKSKRRLNRIR